MSGGAPDFDPRQLWQKQAEMHATITLTDVHAQAARFKRQARLRSLQALLVVPFAIILIWRSSQITSPMMQVGGVLILAGMAFAMWNWLRINSTRALSNEGEALAKAYRHSLIRLRDARRTLLLWCVAPLMPGVALFFAGSWLQLHPKGAMVQVHQRSLLVIILFCVVSIVVGYLLNRRAAAGLQRKIDEL